MSFPYALVAQSLSLVQSGLGSQQDIIGPALLEISRQLQSVNDNLLEINKTMVAAVKAITNLPNEQEKLKATLQAGKASEELSDALRRIDPKSGNVENLQAVFDNISEAHDRLREEFNNLEVLLKYFHNSPLPLLALSHPTVRVIQDYLVASEILFLPDLLIDRANFASPQVVDAVDIKGAIPENDFRAIANDILEVCRSLLLGQNGLCLRFSAYIEGEMRKMIDTRSILNFDSKGIGDSEAIIVQTLGCNDVRKWEAGGDLKKNRRIRQRFLIDARFIVRDLKVAFYESATSLEREVINSVPSAQNTKYATHQHPIDIREHYSKTMFGHANYSYEEFKNLAEKFLEDNILRFIHEAKAMQTNLKPYGGKKISYKQRVEKVTELLEVATYMRNFSDVIEKISEDLESRLA